jgi:hypothetical protein
MLMPDSPLLNFWRAFGDWGFIFVIVGVLGEVCAAAILQNWEEKRSDLEWGKWGKRMKAAERLSGAILIIGLAAEFKGHKRETAILDSANARLQTLAEQADEDAQKFRLKAAELEKELAGVDPLNLPVSSASATVRLQLGQRLNERNLSVLTPIRAMGNSARLEVRMENGWRLIFGPDDFMPYSPDDFREIVDASLHFDLENNARRRYLDITEGRFPVKAIGNITSLKLHVFEYPVAAWASGNITLTFNSTSKTFLIPYPGRKFTNDFEFNISTDVNPAIGIKK